MNQRACKTCKHHTAEFVKEEQVDDLTIPVFNHYCCGKKINGSTVADFGCGKYEERTI